MLDTTHFPKAKKYLVYGENPSLVRSRPFTRWPMPFITGPRSSRASGRTRRRTGPKIFRLPEHVDRFFVSAGVVKMTVPYNKEEVTAAIKLTVRENALESCYIRPLFYYGYGNLGLIPKASPRRARHLRLGMELLHGRSRPSTASGSSSAPGAAIHHSQLDMRAKLGGVYVQSTISGLEARAQGADEALFLNIEGRIAEGPGENLFVVKNGAIRTNDRSESILEGITRTSILEIARDLGIKTSIGPITIEDLTGADEAFFTGTAVEVIPITRLIDGSDRKAPRREFVIGAGKPGPVTLQLRKAYLDIVRGKNPRYEKWLTPVD